MGPQLEGGCFAGRLTSSFGLAQVEALGGAGFEAFCLTTHADGVQNVFVVVFDLP